MRGRTMLRRIDAAEVPDAAVIRSNIRTLRLRNGWSQRALAERMGWRNSSTVCAAEGHRSSWQRKFTVDEVRQLAGIFGITPEQLTTRCVNCEGQPSAGFACLACGAASPLGEPL